MNVCLFGVSSNGQFRAYKIVMDHRNIERVVE